MQLSGKNLVKYAKEAVKNEPEIFEALMEYERTKKLPKMKYKKRANFTLDAKLLRNFRSHCKKQGYNMSARIEKFIEKELENQT